MYSGTAADPNQNRKGLWEKGGQGRKEQVNARWQIKGWIKPQEDDLPTQISTDTYQLYNGCKSKSIYCTDWDLFQGKGGMTPYLE